MKKIYPNPTLTLLILTILITDWTFKANAQNGWEKMAPLSSVRGNLGSCVIGKDIYLFGGLDESVTFLSVPVKYNTETGITTELHNMAIGLALPTASVINNKIYVVGGFIDEYTATNLVQEYDPADDSWVLKKELPKRIGHHTTCVLNDKLYLFPQINME